MRVHFTGTSIPNRFVKAMTTVVQGLRHAQAQQIAASMFGYRDWYQLTQVSQGFDEEPTPFWSLAPRPSDSFVSADNLSQPVPSRFAGQLEAFEKGAAPFLKGRGSIELLRRIYRKAYGRPLLPAPLPSPEPIYEIASSTGTFTILDPEIRLHSVLGKEARILDRQWDVEGPAWTFGIDSSLWVDGEFYFQLIELPDHPNGWSLRTPDIPSAPGALDALLSHIDVERVGANGLFYVPRPTSAVPRGPRKGEDPYVITRF
jgi:hypothetical protein